MVVASNLPATHFVTLSSLPPIQLQESEEKKEGGEDAAEKKDDSIVYADLDKSAMSEGKRPSITVENEKSEYAEITPQPKE